MVGAVLDLWLNDTHQGRLQGLFKTRPSTPCTYAVSGYLQLPDLHGITLNPKGVADCNGGCGISSMKSIAWEIGLDVRPTYSRTGCLDGFTVSWEEA